MNRRGFLRLIGLGAPAAVVAPFVPMPAGEVVVGVDLASKVDEYYCVLARPFFLAGDTSYGALGCEPRH